MREINNNIYLLYSTFTAAQTEEENNQQFDAHVNRLEILGIAYKQMLAHYKGKAERSILQKLNVKDMPENAARALEIAQELRNHHNQEAVLLYYPGRKGEVHLVTEKGLEYAGEFQQVTEAYALQQTGYTYDPGSRSYYTIRN